MEIKIGVKGKIVQGEYANGEVLITEDKEKYDGYYVYVWPKNGSKWPNTNEEMVYDYWAEDFENVREIFKQSDWVIDWYVI